MKITNNKDKMIMVAKKFYKIKYSINDRKAEIDR